MGSTSKTRNIKTEQKSPRNRASNSVCRSFYLHLYSLGFTILDKDTVYLRML